jgi:hypothetical protein
MMFANLNVSHLMAQFVMTLLMMTALSHFNQITQNNQNKYERTSFERSCDRASATRIAD